MTLVIRGTAAGVSVTPERAGWRYVGFEVLRPGAGARRELAGREACVVLLGGRVVISVQPGGHPRFELAVRPDPFSGPPRAVYLPPGTTVDLEGDGEVAIGTAPAKRGAKARPLMDPRLEVRGSGATERRIHHILMEDQEAEALLVTEVVTPGGHWSSYPPHKHDEDAPPRETALEEIYYHRLRDPRGFAVQRVYTADRAVDETATVRDGDVMLVPRGFHAVSAPPGYDSYYLNVMAGPVRRWCVTFDPDHAWLRG